MTTPQRHRHEFTRTLVACLLALAAGCGTSPPVRHYLIAPAAVVPAPVSGHLVVGLGPITLPAYLDRPQMALRTGESRVEYRDTERWAEPLADNVRRVLKENLEASLPGALVRTYPWPRSESLDVQLVIEIARFDADMAGSVMLKGRWTLRPAAASTPVTEGTFEVSQQAANGSADAVASAHGIALGALANKLAEALAGAVPAT